MPGKDASALKFIYEEAAVALISAKGRFLVIGDVHIGAERRLARGGVRLYENTDFMVRKIRRLMKEFSLEGIIILGDVKDSVLYPDSGECESVVRFFDRLVEYKIRVAAGNHDAHLEEIVKTDISDEILVDDVALLHGHRWPSEVAMQSRFILAGHNHAAVSLRDRNGGVYTQKAWLVAKINIDKAKERYRTPNPDARLVVLPAFNDIIVGTPVNMKMGDNLSPLFRNGIFDYAGAMVYSLRGELIGQAAGIPPF